VRVGLRVLTAGLVLVAALADAAGSPRFAFYALLAAVPAAAASGLAVFGELLDEPGRVVQALVWALVLTLVVVGAAARSPALLEGAVPAVGATALAGCLALLSLEGLLAAFAEFKRRTLPSR
jgi:multisubunit Na+/H+ antiporter MnhC subunit